MKAIILCIFILSVTISCFAQSNETLTITTYYPSPYGVYRNLRLHPSEEPTAGVARGVMYFNNTSDTLTIYNNTGWNSLTGGGGGEGYWAENAASHIYNINSGGNVGIGTTSPQAVLHIRQNNTGFANLRLENSAAGSHIWELDSVPPGYFLLRDRTTGNNPIMIEPGPPQGALYLTQSGSLGIGTNSPGARLSVAGQVKITGGSPAAGRVLTSDAAGLATWQTPAGGGGGVTQIIAGSNIAISPASGTGIVSIASSGGGGGGITGVLGGAGISVTNPAGPQPTVGVKYNAFSCGAANQALKAINIDTGAVTCTAASSPSTWTCEVVSQFDVTWAWDGAVVKTAATCPAGYYAISGGCTWTSGGCPGVVFGTPVWGAGNTYSCNCAGANVPALSAKAICCR